MIFYYTCQHHSCSQFPLTSAADSCLKWGTHLPPPQFQLSAEHAPSSHQPGHHLVPLVLSYQSKRFSQRCRSEKVKILSLRKQIKFSFSVSLPPNLTFIFAFQDQAQTSIPEHNIHISPSSFSHRTISYNFFCFLGTLQVCRKAALSTFIPAKQTLSLLKSLLKIFQPVLKADMMQQQSFLILRFSRTFH